MTNKPKKKLFVHATNVHAGGGRSLLYALLQHLPYDSGAVALLDRRMATPDNLPQNLEVKRVKPSIWQRLRAEWWLAQNARLQDTILCFGNLPPLFGLRGHVLVFLQNRYLVDDVKLDGFPLKTRLRLWIERLWLSGRMENASEFIVQTPSMKRLLEARTNGKISVCVLPFMANYVEHVRKMPPLGIQKEKKSILLYVASGEPHKNHRQLIEAWCLLAKDGLFPRLTLTLDRANFAGLCDWMGKKIEQYSLDVENVGNVPHAHVMQLYDRAAALIYPSTFESFGLPLIEAMQAGLPVLASELDYVRDVLDPDQTFNPESAVSIARAVKRFLGVEEQPLPLQDAAGFMRQILGKVK